MDMWRDGDNLGGIWDREMMSIYCTKNVFSIFKKKQNPVYTCPSSNHEPKQWLAWQIENDSDSNMHMS